MLLLLKGTKISNLVPITIMQVKLKDMMTYM